MFFRQEREDAKLLDPTMTRTDPLAIKVHPPTERSYLMLLSAPEQWEAITQSIEDLPIGEMMFEASGRVAYLESLAVSEPVAARSELERIEARYLDTCFRSQEEQSWQRVSRVTRTSGTEKKTA